MTGLKRASAAGRQWRNIGSTPTAIGAFTCARDVGEHFRSAISYARTAAWHYFAKDAQTLINSEQASSQKIVEAATVASLYEMLPRERFISNNSRVTLAAAIGRRRLHSTAATAVVGNRRHRSSKAPCDIESSPPAA